MQLPCHGGGQSYSAGVRESPAGTEPAVCVLSFRAHHAGDVSGEGPGRAVARVHVSVSVMLHRETWDAPRQSWLRGIAGGCRKLFICHRKAVAAVTSCRV